MPISRKILTVDHLNEGDIIEGAYRIKMTTYGHIVTDRYRVASTHDSFIICHRLTKKGTPVKSSLSCPDQFTDFHLKQYGFTLCK